MDRKDFIFKPGLKDDGKPLIDFRTIPLRAILRLKELPPLPDEWDAHEAVGGVEDDRMFGNDKHGDCVIAAQAHKTLTFEKFEQGIVLPITDQEVIDEYYRQSGGQDTGLYLSLAMKEWKNTGWTAAGKHYDIYAFAGVEPKDHVQVKYSIYLLNGVIFGMQVYQTDIDQFKAEEGWHLTEQNGSFLGGHGSYACKYRNSEEAQVMALLAEQARANGGKTWLPRPDIVGYTEKGLWVMTWAVKQFMTWDFWDARVNQAFAVVDNRNKWMAEDSPVDVQKLDGYLQEITREGDVPSECPFANAICRILDTGSMILGRKSRFKTVV